MDRITVTTDRSSLAVSQGYWSKREVFFNNEDDKLVILNSDLTTDQLLNIIITRIDECLPEIIGGLLESSMTRISTTAGLILHPLTGLRKEKWMRGGKVMASWVAKELGDQYASFVADAWCTHFRERPWEGVRGHSGDIRRPGLILVTPWKLLSWSNPSQLLSDLYALTNIQWLPSRLKKNESADKAWNMIPQQDKDLVQSFIPHIDLENDCEQVRQRANLFNSVITAGHSAISLLIDEGVILLPRDHHVTPFAVAQTARFGNVFGNSITNARSKKDFSDIIACSTITDLRDVPIDLRECYPLQLSENENVKYTRSRGIISTLTSTLRGYAQTNNLSDFPLNRLKKSIRVEHPKNSLGWCKEHLNEAWSMFIEAYWSNCQSTDHAKRTSLNHLIQWAWTQEGIQDPVDITSVMLRDAYNLGNESTLYKYFQKKGSFDSLAKFNNWSKVASVFLTVEQDAHLPGSPMHGRFKTNPFKAFNKVPFKKISRNKTPRARLLEGIQEAMVEILLSPDENGMPTFAWAKENLTQDYVSLPDPDVPGASMRVWCPTRTCCLAVLLLLPIRQAQARWLDQGLMDETVYDVEHGEMVDNVHPLRTWRYANNHSQQKQYGRNSGILQMILDPFSGIESLSVFCNTNKTQMWDAAKRTGYEIPWPEGQELIDRATWTTETEGLTPEQKEEVAKLTENDRKAMDRKGRWFKRIYEVIKYQIRWMQQHDPNPRPLSYMHVHEDSQRLASDDESIVEAMPWFAPLFRDLTNTTSFNDHEGATITASAPVSSTKLTHLYHRLAVEAEQRLAEDGIQVSLTTKVGSTNAYQGKACRYNLHSLRVAGISALVEKGVPIHIVQEYVAGHATIAMTFHYLKHQPTYMRERLLDAMITGDILDGWEGIVDQLTKGQVRPEEVVLPNQRYQEHLPNIVADFAAYAPVEGGLCPMGGKGSRCSEGGVYERTIETGATAGDTVVEFGQVQGGCGNCMFFQTGPAFLMEQAMALNTLMLKLRAMGRERKLQFKKLSDLEGDIDDLDKVTDHAQFQTLSLKRLGLKERLSATDKEMTPLILEWYNRYMTFMDSQQAAEEQLMDKNTDLILFAHSDNLDFTPEMMETTDFGLVRQTVEQARYLERKGIVVPDDAGRLIREFMDKILLEHAPQHLLLRIRDEKLATHAASVMAGYVADLVGDDAAQHAIDAGETLKFPMDENGRRKPLDEHTETKLDGLMALISETARNGEAPTFKTLEPKLAQLALETDVA